MAVTPLAGQTMVFDHGNLNFCFAASRLATASSTNMLLLPSAALIGTRLGPAMISLFRTVEVTVVELLGGRPVTWSSVT